MSPLLLLWNLEHERGNTENEVEAGHPELAYM